jgi:ribosome-associated protein
MAITPHAQSVSQEETVETGHADRLSRETVETIVTQLEDDKAEDIVVIDLAGKTSIADHMVVASGRSARQVGAMADHLVEKLKAAGIGPLRVEGKTNADWVLIDAIDVIVHLFRPEVRAFYQIEKMWGHETPVPGATLDGGPRPAAGPAPGGRGARPTG